MRSVQNHVWDVGKCLNWISIVAVCLNINRTLKKEDSQFHDRDDVKIAEKIEDKMAPSWRVNKIHFIFSSLASCLNETIETKKKKTGSL